MGERNDLVWREFCEKEKEKRSGARPLKGLLVLHWYLCGVAFELGAFFLGGWPLAVMALGAFGAVYAIVWQQSDRP